MDFEAVKKEYQKLLNQLGDHELISDWEKFEKLNKRKIFLERIIDKEKEIEEIKNKIEENKIIIAGKEDSELSSLAETETVQFQEKEKNLDNELKKLLENEESLTLLSADNVAAVIVEIRAGTGGQESALFAADLFKMYSKYAQALGWKEKILDSRATELDGFKEIIFELKSASAGGGNVFSKMKYEGGVHRVQRIPETEKSGRVHTSTASVAILPRPKKTQIQIRPDDLKIDFYNASGPGGQNVNKRKTAVRITHISSGIVVASQNERSQLQNKENALSILEAKLLEKRSEEETAKIGNKRKSQIGWAKRAEKIRTYNIPQNRLTDHRIKKSFHDLESIMDGKLEPVVDALSRAEN